MENNAPYISVIVPVYNGGDQIVQCMEALFASTFLSFEIIVVDDGSTDGTADRVRTMAKGQTAVDVRIMHTEKQSGPAVARNLGVDHAAGEIILFIDADVIVRPETIGLVAADFTKKPDVAALFGSYDDEPGPPDFMSQYRNMFHHYHHQHSSPDAYTFWAGCGAIRKTIFEEINGFNHKLYSRPSIEDIELGYRVRKLGYRILLDKDIQVKHLKRWRFLPMLKTDIFQRAIPWARLILETNFMPESLNLKAAEKVSTGIVGLMLLLLPLLFFNETTVYGMSITAWSGIAYGTLFTLFIILNRRLYRFFMRTRGLWFTVRVVPMHILYYLYSGFSYGFCWLTFKICGRRS
jgi:glycosyltransferase involved in cell wall biosynthesis